jgi:hypothetical protein
MLAPDISAFAVEYSAGIKFVEESWHQVIDLSEIVTVNMLVTMRHTRYGKNDGPVFSKWISEFLPDFANFHYMIELHATGCG